MIDKKKHNVDQYKKIGGKDSFELLDFMDVCINGITVLDGASSGKFGGLFVPVCIELTGKIDFEKLEKAIQEVYNRVDSTRLVFEEREGKCYFRILKSYEYNLNVIKYEGKNQKESRKLALEDIKLFNKESVKIHNEIALYVQLYELKKDNYLMSVFLNHCSGDGYAASYILKMIFALYQNPETKDFDHMTSFETYYQNQLKKKSDEKMKEYWSKQIQGVPPIGFREDDLPNKETIDADNYFMVFPSSMLKNIAKKNHVTTFNVLNLATHLALRAVYDTEDSVITIASGNRNSSESLSAVTMMTTFLSNRIQMSDNEKMSELLTRSKKKLIENIKHSNADIETTKMSRVILSFMSESLINMSTEKGLGKKSIFSPFPTLEGIEVTFLFIVGLEQQGAVILSIQCCKPYFKNEDMIAYKKAFEDAIFFMEKDTNRTLAEYLQYVRNENNKRNIKYHIYNKIARKRIEELV